LAAPGKDGWECKTGTCVAQPEEEEEKEGEFHPKKNYVNQREERIRQCEAQAVSTERESSNHPEEDWLNSKVYKLYGTMRTPYPLFKKQHTGP
jgi:hypothetical protein